MTLRIQKRSEGRKTVLRLSSRLRASDRAALSEEIETSTETIALDLEEVALVDTEIVQFLARCETEGVELLQCSPFIRDWISRESDGAGKV
jgi:anti-anti-sigma regulatory factor